jgi:triphosphoribosyl-dephospho-CoA synthase
VRDSATRFLERGGSAAPDWQQEAEAAHRLFVRHRLSPGGAADLLAATCFVHVLDSGEPA